MNKNMIEDALQDIRRAIDDLSDRCDDLEESLEDLHIPEQPDASSYEESAVSLADIKESINKYMNNFGGSTFDVQQLRSVLQDEFVAQGYSLSN